MLAFFLASFTVVTIQPTVVKHVTHELIIPNQVVTADPNVVLNFEHSGVVSK